MPNPACTARGGRGIPRESTACPHVLAHLVVAPRPFVNVVSEVDDQIEIVLDHVLVRGVQAGLEMLARSERELELSRLRVVRRRSPRPADGTLIHPDVKAIEVPAIWLKASNFHVYRVRPIGNGRRLARGDRTTEFLVFRHFPVHRNRLVRHASAVKRVGGQPRPNHEPVRRRIPRGHAQLKRITGVSQFRQLDAERPVRPERGRSQRTTRQQERSTRRGTIEIGKLPTGHCVPHGLCVGYEESAAQYRQLTWARQSSLVGAVWRE
jgi:hypothetical protein